MRKALWLLAAAIPGYIAGLYTQEAKDGIAWLGRQAAGLSPLSALIGLAAGLTCGAWWGARQSRARAVREAVFLQARVRCRYTGEPERRCVLSVALDLVGSGAAGMGVDVKALRAVLGIPGWPHRVELGAVRMWRRQDQGNDLCHEFEVPIPERYVVSIARTSKLSEPPMAQVSDVYVVTDRGIVTKQGPPSVISGDWEGMLVRLK